MRELRIDIFEPKLLEVVNAICFTSNGILKRNGELVMGAGVAKAFSDKMPLIARDAGKCVNKNGNVCQEVGKYFHSNKSKVYTISVVAFPTKNHWKDKSDIDLIIRSARRLREMIEQNNWKAVALPRPGVLNGGLEWGFVRDKLEPILDNRVVAVYL